MAPKKGFTTIVTRSIRKPTLRSVYVTFPYVGPEGSPYHFEMTSFKGGPVELYRQSKDGIMFFEGTIRDYAPGGESLRQEFREAWYSQQPSQAARRSFELSAAKRSWEIPEWNR